MATSGQRDKLVTIQQRIDGVSDSGNPIATWPTLAQVYMFRKDTPGREGLGGSQVAAEFNTEWHMSYLSTMDPELVDVPKKRRLVHNGRTHDIRGAMLEQRYEGRGIQVTTVVGTGR